MDLFKFSVKICQEKVKGRFRLVEIVDSEF